MIVALLGITFLKSMKSPKKGVDLATHKLLRCNSCVANRMRQIIRNNSFLPQCRMLHVGRHLQLSGGSMPFHFVNFFFLIFSTTSIYKYKLTSWFTFSQVQPTHLPLSSHLLPTPQGFAPKKLSQLQRGAIKDYKDTESSPSLRFLPHRRQENHQEGLEMVVDSILLSHWKPS